LTFLISKIGESMVAHRIWLWGFASSSTLVVVTLNIAGTVLYGNTLSATPMGTQLLSLLSLIAAIAIALAFFPPAR